MFHDLDRDDRVELRSEALDIVIVNGKQLESATGSILPCQIEARLGEVAAINFEANVPLQHFAKCAVAASRVQYSNRRQGESA